MDEFPLYYKKVLKLLVYALSASFVLWAVLPQFRPILSGLILGEAGCLFNTSFLARKVRKVVERAVDNNKGRSQTGFITRACVSFLVVLISVHYSQYFNLVSTLIGLCLFHFVALFKGFLYILKTRKSRKLHREDYFSKNREH
ncbi:MAG TPA: ATP synthase subunit I [Bacillales bacterium]|nr:ATP synthase subunit I [Bacillales bacterium]